jgi:transcription-repair coupling factor (superfamily II helicase)
VLKDLVASKKLFALCKAVEKEKTFVMEGLWDSPKAVLSSIVQEVTGKNILIITGKVKEESRIFDDFPMFYDGLVEDFPSWETLPSENITPSPDIVGERYRILKNIIDSKKPCILISSVQACLQKVISSERLKSLCITLKVGEEISFSKFVDRLVEMGYQRKVVAADKGEFAVRGGIVDVFPVGSPDPIRVEFWGDEVESMRHYDPIGQKSVEKISKIEITPSLEMELLQNEENLSTILDYLGPETVVIFDDIVAIEDRYVALEGIPGAVSRSFSSFHEFFDSMADLQKFFWTHSDVESLSEVKVERNEEEKAYSSRSLFHTINFEIFDRKITAKRWYHPFHRVREFLCPVESASGEVSGEKLLESISGISSNGMELKFICSTDSDENHLKQQLSIFDVSLPEKTEFKRGYLSSGFILEDVKQAIVPLTEFTRRFKIRRQKQRSTYHSTPSEMHELKEGDLVVHINAGVGKFQGIERQKDHNSVDAEFFVIEYADNAKMYVPFSQAHLITKYVGTGENTNPKLHALGSSRWKKTRQQTEKAIVGYASSLLQLYAERKLKRGFVYPSDSEDCINFEKDFPFFETEDQLAAISALKADMYSDKPMDRLVCGDVGYGKTEVAMRAAFKAVVDGGKQVAVLVPTTVLALQHFETFVERMWNYPVKIGVLSRFRSFKESNETLEGVANGSVDILIGTHRIIGKDVVYKDLGLVVIDEEQRFGVRAKEYLKTLRASVDCLSLSATPIPRTLYMALLGARDMSTIVTPPQDRLPIKTIVCESDDQVMKNALLRELTRDGQAYVIHNRVESIERVAEKIRKLLPNAKVLTAHGQMKAEEIDQAFHAFKSGKIDILVATTIVENGIDIPNANTILIDRADTFGVADLYQLRGRVGRWNRRAYAYFLTPPKRVIPAIARKRLEAIVEAGGGYGGGMKVAMRDLEIRGAGNILGTEQSGHVTSIGFHFYCKLLKRTIEALRGDLPSKLCDTKMEFSYDARLPEDYVNATSLRLELYQRLGEAFSWKEVDSIMEEIKDRFGSPPKPVLWLYHLNRIRVFASRNNIMTMKINKMSLLVEGREKGYAVTRKMLLNEAKSPKDLETKVLAALKKSFNL